jgi:hypothetical protein
MDSTIAIILVCGLLNVIPWLLLAYFRPDKSISEQVSQTDEALAIVAKALFERLENLEDLAGGFEQFQEINPFQNLIAKFLDSRLAVNDVYERNSDGTFNGAQTLKEIKTENID